MKLSTFKYHLGQGFRGMIKNGFMSLAAIATVAACSFILILSLCVCMNINFILRQIEETIGITVFLGPDVSDEMAESIGERIRAIDHVTEVTYKSAEDNLNEVIDSWENASILKGLEGDNPLPASYEISLDGAAYQDQVVKALETLQVSVEAELNAALTTDDIERIYLDENGNQITRKQAEALGIVEPEETTAAESTTTAPETTTAAQAEASTQVVTSGAQADAAAEAVTEEAAAAPATEAQTQPQTEAPTEAPKEEETEAAETTTYSADPSKDLINTLNEAVDATAGGRAQLESSYMPSADGDGGVAGTELYDASQYGMGEYEYKGIEKIRHATELAHTLVSINTAVRIFSIIIVVILCVISISIIMNTIRLTVVIRKNEINIMKYVGATDWFIRWPFIIEGMLIGFIGSVIPTILCFLGYSECLRLVAEKVPVMAKAASFAGALDIFMYVAPITIAFGVLLGIIGSASSMRKYLRV